MASAGPSSAVQRDPNDGKKRERRARKPESPEVTYSKALSRILRHRAREEGLTMRGDGFIRVEELLRRPKLRGLDFALLQKLVTDSDKQRFALRKEPDASGQEVWWIKLDDLELRKVESAEVLPVVLHGTYKRHWAAISQEGLKRMTRTHIHLASGRFGEEGVISGVRKDCDLFIYVDVAKALVDGIDFFISPNGVILTRGLDGTLPPAYFARVVDRDDQPAG